MNGKTYSREELDEFHVSGGADLVVRTLLTGKTLHELCAELALDVSRKDVERFVQRALADGRIVDVDGIYQQRSERSQREQSGAAASNEPQIIVCATKYANAYPAPQNRVPVALAPLGDALTDTFETDAHFAAYSTDVQRRLGNEAVGKVSIAMVYLVADADDPIAHGLDRPARPEWREAEAPKLDALFAAHPGAIAYPTGGGYRTVFGCESFAIASRKDTRAWWAAYGRFLTYLRVAFGIVADPACKDFSRLYRLPNVMRDGKQVEGSLRGDPRNIEVLPMARLPEVSAARDAALKLLRKECAKVQEAPDTTRNGVLNKSAFTLGGLVEAGHLERCEVEDGLLTAILKNGGNEAKDVGVIASGMASGMREPWTPMVPAPRGVVDRFAKRFGLEPGARTKAGRAKGRDDQGKLCRGPSGLPRVERGRDVHRVLDDLDEALSDPKTGDPRIYQRTGELVIARGVMAEDAKRLRIAFAPSSVILCSLRASSLLPRITEHVEYGYWGYEEGEDGTRTPVWKDDLPAGTIMAGFLSKVFWAHSRPIRGISATPIIHLDGTIVAAGYDSGSQYYVASNVELPPIPERPTPDEATAALAELVEPFAEFQFELEDERYSPVALVLTLLLRPVIKGNVPAFVQSAPQKNCGKSLTVKAAVLQATGQIPASNTWAKETEEQEKMLGAAADAGADVVFFDNVQEGSVIGGAPLDKVLTCDGQNSFRVLGLTQLKRLPWNAVVCFTANRARIGGDTDRRAVVSTLIRSDAPRESFTHADLLGYIERDRPRLLGAAFTLIRAWIQAGSPGAGVRRLDSFEHWASTVAAMIRWAGGGDVRSLVRDEEGTDEDGQELALLRGIHAWLRAQDKTETTVKALLEDVFASQVTTAGQWQPRQELEELRAAIEAIGGFIGKGEHRKFDARRFGKRLAGMRDLLQGSYRLKRSGESHGVAKWTVTRVEGGLRGVGGVDPNSTRAREIEITPQSVTTPQNAPSVTAGTNPPNPPNPPAGGVGAPARAGAT